MNRQFIVMSVFVFLISVFLFFNVSCSDNPAGPEGDDDGGSDPRNLKVTVNFSGTGTVDAGHPIVVGLSKHPQDITPAKYKILTAASGQVLFKDISFNPCYLSIFYDTDGNNDYSFGESYETYNDTFDIPAAIKISEGTTKSVSTEFDDRYIYNANMTLNDGIHPVVTWNDYGNDIYAFYSNGDDHTIVHSKAASGTGKLQIEFTGSSTGSFSRFDAELIYNDGANEYIVNEAIGRDLILNITNYNAPGNLIEGKFSAVVSNSAAAPDKYVITTGRFSAQRQKD